MACEKQPDLGAGTGFSWYIWNKALFYKTVIQYSCKIGQAFDGIYKRKVNSTCDYQVKTDQDLTWKYSDTNKLPNCIRKEIFNCVLF